MFSHEKNVSGRCMSHDESPFLDLGELQGWLAAMGSALKHSSELLMLPESRDVCRMYGARSRSGGF